MEMLPELDPADVTWTIGTSPPSQVPVTALLCQSLSWGGGGDNGGRKRFGQWGAHTLLTGLRQGLWGSPPARHPQRLGLSSPTTARGCPGSPRHWQGLGSSLMFLDFFSAFGKR